MFDIIEKIKKEDLIIICNNNVKMKILNSINFLANVTFKTDSEAVNDLLGYYDEVAIYAIKHFCNCKYDRAKNIYASLIIPNNDVKIKELKGKLSNLYHEPKEYHKKILVIGKTSGLLDYALKKVKDVEYYDFKDIRNIKLYKFNSIINEVEFLAQNIIKLKENNETDFGIYVGDDEYIDVINEVFSFYDLEIKNNTYSNIYSIPSIKDFISSDDFDINNINLDNLKNIEAKNLLIEAINSLAKIDCTKDDLLDYLKYHMFKVESKGITINDYTSFNPFDKFTFVLGVAFKSIPKIYKDIGYYDDNYLNNIGIRTSFEETIMDKEMFLKMALSCENLICSYSTNMISGLKVETSIFDGIKINDLDDGIIHYDNGGEKISKFMIADINSYSRARAKLEYSKILEKEKNYNEKDNRKSQFENYVINNIGYDHFDSKFTPVNQELIDKLIIKNGNHRLSYTRLETYYSCPYKYFSKYILNLSDFDSNATSIGSVIHLFLENYIKNRNYTLRDAIDEYDRLTRLEHDDFLGFSLSDVYYEKYEQYLNDLKKELTDEERELLGFDDIKTEYSPKDVTIPGNPNIILNGKIDKVLKNSDNKTIVFDYKTGTKIKLKDKKDDEELTIDDIKKYQLFIYLILLDTKFDEFAGVFYQRILPKNKDDLENKKLYIPYGYRNKDILGDTFARFEGNCKTPCDLLTKESYDESIKKTYELIDEYRNRITKGDFHIRPLSDDECKYCKYSSLCLKKKIDNEEDEDNE